MIQRMRPSSIPMRRLLQITSLIVLASLIWSHQVLAFVQVEHATSVLNNPVHSALRNINKWTPPYCNGRNEFEGACSFHGKCNSDGNCSCDTNFDGIDCSVCKDGLTGPDCDIPVCFGELSKQKDVCGGRGQCLFNNTSYCKCFDGYSGIGCQNFQCNGIDKQEISVCHGRGQCTQSNKCTCQGNYDPLTYCQTCLGSYQGEGCTLKFCSPQTTCSNRGSCDSQLNCVCSGNFQGTYCQECKLGFVGSECQFECGPNQTCFNRGVCNENGTCSCSKTSMGQRCETCLPGWCGPKCDFSIDFHSFGFSRNGDFVYATISTPMKKLFDCSELIIDEEGSSLFGRSPTCIIDGDRSIFKIILGSGSLATPNIEIQVRHYFNSEGFESVELLEKDFQPNAPMAVISTVSSIVSRSCGKLFFDGLLTRSFDKYSLDYEWKVTAAPTNADLKKMNSEVRSFKSPAIDISALGYNTGKYTMQLTVKNSNTNLESSDQITVEIVDEILPTVSILNGEMSYFTLGSPYSIKPVLSFGPCVPNDTIYSDYSFSYVFNPNGSIVQVFEVETNGNMLVFDPYAYPYTIVEGDYNFILKVTNRVGASIEKPFKVRVLPVPLQLEFNIDELTQSSDQDVVFKLTKKGNGMVKLTCLNLDTNSLCDGFDEKSNNINPVLLSFQKRMPPGIYEFSAQLSNGKVWTQCHATVTVLNSTADSVIRVSIFGTTNVNLNQVDPSQDLVLQSLCYDGLFSHRVFEWSSNDIDLDIESIVKYNTYIIIPKRLLVPGLSYSISLSITDGQRYGESTIAFTVNHPPLVGSLSNDVDDHVNEALVHEYVIAASNWFDSSLPLRYTYYIGKSADRQIPNEWFLLKDESYSDIFRTVLPSGFFHIKVKVSDSQGASSEVSSPIAARFTSETINHIPIIGNSTVTTGTLFAMITTLNDVKTGQDSELLRNTIDNMLDSYFDQFIWEERITSNPYSIYAPQIYTIKMVAIYSSMLNLDTVSKTIEELSTLLGAKIQGGSKRIVLSSDLVDQVKSSCNLFETFLLSVGSTSTINGLLDLMRLIRVKLMEIELEVLPPDGPAIIQSNSKFGYIYYMRTMSTSSLGSLVDFIDTYAFNFTQNFGHIPQLTYLTNVKIKNILYKSIATNVVSESKQLIFQVYEQTNSQVKLSQSSPIAHFTIPRIGGSSQNIQDYACRMLSSGSNFYETPLCQVYSLSNSTFSIAVSQTGSFIVVQKMIIPPPTPMISIPIPIQSNKPEPTISKQPLDPNPILSMDPDGSDMIKISYTKYLAFLFLIPVFLFAIVIIALVLIICVKKFRGTNHSVLRVELEESEYYIAPNTEHIK